MGGLSSTSKWLIYIHIHLYTYINKYVYVYKYINTSCPFTQPTVRKSRLRPNTHMGMDTATATVMDIVMRVVGRKTRSMK